MVSLDDEVARLTDGRVLNPMDQSCVETVASWMVQLAEARRRITEEGVTILDAADVLKEHPAVAIEKKASQEIRGWVAARPDLFGKQEKAKSGRRRFEPKIVGDP